MKNNFYLNDSNYISTGDAANILALSRGSVLNLVNSGVLEAWRTMGGHRRITKESIKRYLENKPILKPIDQSTEDKIIFVLVIGDQNFAKNIDFTSKGKCVKIISIESIYRALFELKTLDPDIIIIQIPLNIVDDEELVEVLEFYLRNILSKKIILMISEINKNIFYSIPSDLRLVDKYLMPGSIDLACLHVFLIAHKIKVF